MLIQHLALKTNHCLYNWKLMNWSWHHEWDSYTGCFRRNLLYVRRTFRRFKLHQCNQTYLYPKL